MTLFKQIAQYQKENDLSPTEMGRLFNLPKSQYYHNWISRASIPKNYISRANEILGIVAVAKNFSEIDIKGYFPLISYVQAGQWHEAIDLYEPGYAENVAAATVAHSRSSFALRVEGASMTLPYGVEGRSFLHGMIIYIDPEQQAEQGDYVIAKRVETGEVTFKKLSSEEGRPVLIPLNSNRGDYPIIRDEFEIIGRVIDAAWGGV